MEQNKTPIYKFSNPQGLPWEVKITEFEKLVDKLSFYIVTDRRMKQIRHTMCRPYRYLIYLQGTSYQAFENKRAFKNWLYERNLGIKRLGRGYCQIIGSYYEVSHMEPYESVRAKLGESHNWELSNGDYTDSWVTRRHGKKAIHIINPNFRRRVWDYSKIRPLVG